MHERSLGRVVGGGLTLAARSEFRCDRCDHVAEAWDDGNPYFVEEDGTKRYAYHPDHEALARCVGNDSPHLCLACAGEFMQDSRAPRDTCPRCSATEIVDLMRLDGCRCPWCRVGVLRARPGFTAIS